MGRGYEEELFSENVDRLLAGQGVASEPETRDDLRTALDFASQMVSLRASPSPQFQARLKAHLLQKLSEEEIRRESRTGWFWKLVPREPLWQAVAVLAIMIVVGGIWWGSHLRSSPPEAVSGPKPPITSAAPASKAPATSQPASTAAPASSAPATSAPPRTTAPGAAGAFLVADASVNQGAYRPGETVQIEVTLRNAASQPFTIPQFPPVLSLMQASSGQPVYSFSGGQNSRTLASGESAGFTLSWNQLDAQGRHAAFGVYYLELEDISYQGTAIKLNLSRPVRFEILPSAAGTSGPGRTIEVNQTRVTSGLTITLRRIDLTDKGFIVTAFVDSPPDYFLQPGTPAVRPTRSYEASSGYSFNGGWVKEAGQYTIDYFGTGMAYTWYITEPVPPDTSEIAFVINAVGSWKGTWQFNIPIK
jgi:hypothetical protein